MTGISKSRSIVVVLLLLALVLLVATACGVEGEDVGNVELPLTTVSSEMVSVEGGTITRAHTADDPGKVCWQVNINGQEQEKCLFTSGIILAEEYGLSAHKFIADDGSFLIHVADTALNVICVYQSDSDGNSDGNIMRCDPAPVPSSSPAQGAAGG